MNGKAILGILFVVAALLLLLALVNARAAPVMAAFLAPNMLGAPTATPSLGPPAGLAPGYLTHHLRIQR